MRLFTAIELPANVADHLARITNTLRARRDLKNALSFTKEDKFHITLKFLGEVADDKVPALASSLQTLRVMPMNLSISHFLVLPGQGPARVLAANVAGDTKPLADLFGQIESACQPLGIPREAREYKPHVTFGRFRRPSQKFTAQTLIKMIDSKQLPTPAFIATEFVLFGSALAPDGAVHSLLARFGPRSP
jgi:2'-5' RNA ligase